MPAPRRGKGRLEQYDLDIKHVLWDVTFPYGFDVIVHCASQVSHPRSIDIPMQDFMINAYGTIKLLEYVRKHSERAKFVYIGSAKIYGENVDHDPTPKELKTRYEGDDIDESVSIDQTRKTPFGTSKAYADLITQEYGQLYGLQTAVLRPSCFAGRFTRPTVHQRWEAFIIQKILRGETVEVFGHRGKQLRDILHCDDLTDAIMMMLLQKMPRKKGDVFNIGGGWKNAISVCELIARVEKDKGVKAKVVYRPKRYADWMAFVTDNSKLQYYYPKWKVRRSLDYIINELYEVLPLLK